MQVISLQSSIKILANFQLPAPLPPESISPVRLCPHISEDDSEIEKEHCTSSKTSVRSSRKYFVHLFVATGGILANILNISDEKVTKFYTYETVNYGVNIEVNSRYTAKNKTYFA